MNRARPLLFLLCTLPLLAQTPPPTPLPQTPAATPTLQARSNLVILDVVVTDKSHAPIHGLKLADFHLREGSADETIKTIEEHTPSTAQPALPLPALPPGVFTNFSPSPANGPVNILLLDRLNTPLKDQPYLRDQLLTFLRTMKPGTRLAVFGLNTQLVYLQGFTSDPALLLAALQSKKNSPRQSALLDAPGESKLSDSIADAAARAVGATATVAGAPAAGAMATVLANVQQFEAEQQSNLTQLRVRYTLDAMNTLARYLAGIPGRKNLLWFSGAFPLSILPDGDLQNPFAAVADMQDQFRATTNLLSRSQVAVYPIDARGLQTAPMLDASQSGSKYARNPTTYGKDLTQFNTRTLDEQTTMRQMAFATGGQAFVNTNGLAAAVAKAIDQGSSYYTITYTPTDTKLDGSFRKIQISLPRPGVELSYRRGYYADPPNAPGRKQLTTSAFAPTAQERTTMRSAMLRGAPNPTQILFKALVVPAGPPTDEAIADTNQASPNAKGPFRKYLVNYAVAPQDINLKPTSTGHYDIALEFAVVVYDPNGVAFNSVVRSIRANITTAAIQEIRTGGLQFHQVVSVPAKGEFFLRIAVHDLLVDHIGAIEVPIAAVSQLAEVAPPPPPKPADPSRVPPTLNNLPR